MPVGINYTADVSAQLKSAVILAGLNSYGTTEIIEKMKSRNHTENILKKNFKAIKIRKGTKNLIKIYGKKTLQALFSTVCGHYCVYFVLFRCRGNSLRDIVHTFSSN